MAFVPQYECDVFVSYATANNLCLSAGEPGWVSRFRQAFQPLLDERLGRCHSSEVWMDNELRGNEPFAEQLRSKVSRAAVLLVVLSDAYLKSEWCLQELEIFAAAAGGEAARTGRLFLVHYEYVSPETWPSVLHGLSGEKYRFFREEPNRKLTTPLGYPIPDPKNPAHASFYDRLRELIPDIARKLGELRRPSEAFGASLSDSTGQVPFKGSTVFLAEVCGEMLYDQRQLVKSHLEQCGLRVLPIRSYGQDATEEMDRDLAESLLFVQMLGRFGGGFEAAQHQRAAAAGLPILRWRSRELKVAAVDNIKHRQLLEGPDVQAMEFDELKRAIEDHVRVLSVKRPLSRIEGEHFVLVDSMTADRQVASDVVAQLEEWNIGYDVMGDTDSLRDLAESNVYDALLVIYGACPHEWLRQELIKCRQILLAKKSRAPACAVYIGPPPKAEPLRCRPPRVTVIDTQDKQQLRAFIESLPSEETSP